MIPHLLAIILATSPVSDCSFKQGYEYERFHTFDKHSEIMSVRIQVLGEMNEWVSKQDFEQGQPMAPQFTEEQEREFNLKRGRIAASTFNSMVEARRLRDVVVIGGMVKAAERIATHGIEGAKSEVSEAKTFDDLSDENKHLALLFILSEKLPSVDLTDSAIDECNLVSGIYAKQLQILEEMQRIDVGSLQAEIDEIQNKYEFDGPIDVEKISAEDRRRLESYIVPQIQYGQRLTEYIRNLERLKRLEKFSKYYRELSREDLLSYGPDLSSLGKTIEAKKTAGELTDTEIKLDEVWILMNNLFESEF